MHKKEIIHRPGKHHRRPAYQKPGFYELLITIFTLLYLIIQLYRFNALPFITVFILVDVEAVFLVLIWYLTMKRHRKKFKITGTVIAVILCFFNLFGGYRIQQLIGTIDMMNDVKVHNKGNYVELYVMKDSSIETVQGLEGRNVGIMSSLPESQASLMLKWIEESGVSISVHKYDSSLKLAYDLKGRVLDGMILFQPNLSLIEDYEGLENFHNEIRSLHQIEVPGTGLAKSEQVDVTQTPFTILVSGIDTYGEASAAGRSDVNLLMTVNPGSREVLMLSIPRDLYVEVQSNQENTPFTKGEKDKLTHTGIYGSEVTEKTIETLLDTQINFVVRVNFTTLVELVDDLGGVDVDNPNSFYIGNREFPQGTIHLDGEAALAFSRARYAFLQGDRERGKNQMRVVEAILQKVISPELLKNYSSILNTVSQSIQMNITSQDIASLVNMQLIKPSSWNIYSYSVTGTDGNEYSPALGDNAYVMIPDENVLKNAKQDITAIKNGEKPLYTNE